jgi:prophage regulatory protein
MSAERPLPGWPRGLREDLAAEYIGLSVSSIRTLRHRGQFPAPIPLTKGRLIFLRDDLDAWLDRKAGRLLVTADAADWPDA